MVLVASVVDNGRPAPRLLKSSYNGCRGGGGSLRVQFQPGAYKSPVARNVVWGGFECQRHSNGGAAPKAPTEMVYGERAVLPPGKFFLYFLLQNGAF